MGKIVARNYSFVKCSPGKTWSVIRMVQPRRRAAAQVRTSQSSSRSPDGLTGAHGLIATVLEPNAENREALCNQSRCSFPSADGQTEDVRHEEQREQ